MYLGVWGCKDFGDEQRLLRIDEEDLEEGIAVNGDLHLKIRVKNLWRKTDEGTIILSGVSVDICKGTVVGVIGPSGSGKSTFLRALNRLWEPPADSVFLDNHDISRLDVLALRRRVGMLFQTPALFEGSVADNIRYGPALRGEKLSDEKVAEYLGLADLESSLAARSASGLSVGQAQRVALARALANEPEVLLLDEPTSALDPISTEHIEKSIGKLKRGKGMTIIMVSHSVKQIQRIADLVFLLVDGQIVETLKPDQLCNANHPTALRFLELSS
jgi:ABC-type phosphate transport system ATPase subunit